MKKSPEDVKALVERALEKGQVVSLITYYLSDYGEMVLHTITETILARFNRGDLQDVVYTCVKELIMNATKANLKRILLQENGYDPDNPEHYEECMRMFKKNIGEEKIKSFRGKFKQYGLPVTVTIYTEGQDALKVKIKNNFTLLKQEEERIREKFSQAVKYTDIMQFYMDHADETEGAGMGLSLVGILFEQSGIDKHQFSIYSSEKYRETIARLEIPLSESYESRRLRFEREAAQSDLPVEEFRTNFLASLAKLSGV